MNSKDQSELIWSYLDGSLSNQQRQAFEQKLSQDATLAEELEQLRALDGLLAQQAQPHTLETDLSERVMKAYRARLIARHLETSSGHGVVYALLFLLVGVAGIVLLSSFYDGALWAQGQQVIGSMIAWFSGANVFLIFGVMALVGTWLYFLQRWQQRKHHSAVMEAIKNL